jgi:hypothetical protein
MKQKYKLLVFGLTRSRLEPTIYHTRTEHASHSITDAVLRRRKVRRYQRGYKKTSFRIFEELYIKMIRLKMLNL